MSYNIKTNKKNKYKKIANIKNKIDKYEKYIDNAKLFFNDGSEKVEKLRDYLEYYNIKLAQLQSDEGPPYVDDPDTYYGGEEEIEESSSKNIDLTTKTIEEFKNIIFTDLVFYSIEDEYNGADVNKHIEKTENDFNKIIASWDETETSPLYEYKEEKTNEYNYVFNKEKFINKFLKSLNLPIDSTQETEEQTRAKQLILPKIRDYSQKIIFKQNNKEFIAFETPESDVILEYVYGDLEAEDIVGRANEQSEGNFMNNQANKKFNLKKHADKLFDSIRERPIQEDNIQYRTRHPKSLPWYEEVYIHDAVWRTHIMDKYYPESVNKDTGEYEGGYIEDRFTVHKNTEGNSLQARVNKNKDRPESYSTERRLEIMREEEGEERGYEPTEGSRTSPQTKEISVASKKNNKMLKKAKLYDKTSVVYLGRNQGLHKVSLGGKTLYLDTFEQLQLLKKMAESPTLLYGNFEEDEEGDGKHCSCNEDEMYGDGGRESIKKRLGLKEFPPSKKELDGKEKLFE